MATYEEINRFWTINDVMNANEALDIQAEIEAHVMKNSGK